MDTEQVQEQEATEVVEEMPCIDCPEVIERLYAECIIDLQTHVEREALGLDTAWSEKMMLVQVVTLREISKSLAKIAENTEKS